MDGPETAGISALDEMVEDETTQTMSTGTDDHDGLRIEEGRER